MTFPKIELLCPQCKEPMTLINGKGELKDCNISGYDKMVEYHFQCKSNERHKDKWHDDEGKIVNVKDDKDPIHEKIHLSKCTYWCDISTEEEIAVFRILIPKIGNGNYSDSVSITTQTNKPLKSLVKEQYKKQMEQQ